MRKAYKVIVEYLLIPAICGIVIGALIGVFSLAIVYVAKLANIIHESHELILATIFLLVVLMGYISRRMANYNHKICASGIPQLEMRIKLDEPDDRWYLTIPMMFFSALISIFNGLCLGGEGPMVLFGGEVGDAANHVLKRKDRDFIAVCSGAGFSLAFLSPLAGLFYTIEMITHRFDIKLMIKSIIVICLACLTLALFKPISVFDPDSLGVFSFKYYYLILIIPIVIAFSSRLFVKLTLYMMDVIGRHRDLLIVRYRINIIFVLFFVLALTIPKYIGSGQGIIESILTLDNMLFILILIGVRIILTALSINSTSSGGSVIPSLCIGGLIGLLISLIMNNLVNMPTEMNYSIILICAVCFLGVQIHIPLSSIFIVFSFVLRALDFNLFVSMIIPTIMIIGLTEFIARVFKHPSLYEELIIRRERRELKEEKSYH